MFISRREGLADGSIDPNTSNTATQMTLLAASALSPSLVPLLANIPASMLLESIHRRNLRRGMAEGGDADAGADGVALSLPPEHYLRTMDPQATTATATQTTAELAALNILYGGVRGRVYLDSMREFCRGMEKGEVGRLVEAKLAAVEAICGFKLLSMDGPKPPVDQETVAHILAAADPTTIEAQINENGRIFELLCQYEGIDSEQRTGLLLRVRRNLQELLASCPVDMREEYLKAVDLSPLGLQ